MNLCVIRNSLGDTQMVHYKFLTHFLCTVLISASSACLGDVSDSSRSEHSRNKSDGLTDVNAKNSDGDTALMLASSSYGYGHADVVELLERFKQEMLKKKSEKAQGGD